METNYTLTLDDIDPTTIEDWESHRLADADAEVVERIAASMMTDGYTGDPVVVNDCEAPEIVGGRHRVLAAIAAGLESIPVVVVSGGYTGDIIDFIIERDDLDELTDACDVIVAEVRQ